MSTADMMTPSFYDEASAIAHGTELNNTFGDQAAARI